MTKTLKETAVLQNWGAGQTEIESWRDLLETAAVGKFIVGQIGKAQAQSYNMPEDVPFFIMVMSVSSTWAVALALPLSTSGKIYQTYKRAQDTFVDWIEM